MGAIPCRAIQPEGAPMSTTTGDAADISEELAQDDERQLPQYSHHTDLLYIKVAAVLVALTSLEVYSSYAHWLGHAFLPIMLTLMATKFLLVVLFFMHLKWDSKLFGRLFWAGAFLAIAVYVGALATFQFFVKA
jgi:cytochrome c oxidase subunit 4